MLQPLEQVVQQISRTDQQLQYYMILEQQETNRLLKQIIENNQAAKPIQDKPKLERKPRQKRGA